PLRRSGTGDTCKSKRRGQHMLAEAGVWILRVEGIDEQSVARLDLPGPNVGIQVRGRFQLTRDPEGGHRGFSALRIRCSHVQSTLYCKVNSVKIAWTHDRSSAMVASLLLPGFAEKALQ